MAWSPEDIAKFEDLISKLAAESHRAQPGSDDGLIPIFSLVGELAESFDDEAIRTTAALIQETIQPMLDNATPFDESTIAQMKDYAKWGESCLAHLQQEEEIEPYAIPMAPPPSPPDLTIPSDLALAEQATAEETAAAAKPSDCDAEPEATACPWGSEAFQRFSSIAQQLSAELLLAEPGSDEGMLPVYSLLKDLQSEFEENEIILSSIEQPLAKMDGLLDAAKPCDEHCLKLLTEFNFWLETARAELREGRLPMPFEPSEDVQALAPEAPATDASGSAGAAPAQNEFAAFDVLMDLNLEENQELLVEFHSEAVDHLGQIEAAVLELEQDVGNRDAINSMFRSFHTIKGVAGFLNLIPINRLAHEVESLMDLVRNDQLEAYTGIIDLVLASKDTIGALIEQISQALSDGTLPTKTIPVSHLMQRARWAQQGPEAYAALMGQPAPASGEAESKIEPFPGVDLENQAEPVTPPANRPSEQADAQRKKTNASATIRVNTWKLDNLMDMVGELVIVQSQLHESSKSDARHDSHFQQNMSQLTRITKELQHTSMSLRMIPIKPTFQKMGRIVRDLSAKSGKKVRFEVVGEETELDRNVVEEIGDPLVHMVRNALDHGLEPPEDRQSAGKDTTGHVTLKAYHQGSNIVIELSDDGRGINADRVLKKAVTNGVVREDEQLSKEEIYKLIFAPGFSTADKITDISGRGVGMDVVKRNIEKLRGKIEITSELGKGSTFKILLPLTMAIVDGLVVKVGEDRFILPTTSVKVALRPEQQNLAKIQGNTEVLNIRGKIIPLFRLHNHFQIPGAVTNPREATVVVVETASKPCGLLVDDMVSKQEVVIKSLGSMMQGIPGVSGGAILGDGTIALILDPATLITNVA